MSRRGVFPLSFTLDHVGPMTRTVADNALMLEAIAGHDPLDPGSAAAPSGHYRAALERGVRGLRIGFVRHFHEIDMPAEPEVTAALEHVAAHAADAGRRGARRHLPSLGEFARGQPRDPAERGLVDPCASGCAKRPGDYGQLARRRLMAGAFLGAGDYVIGAAAPARDDRRGRSGAARGRRAAVRQLDGSGLPHRRPAEVERTYPRQARTPFNVTGHPALAMMAGLSSGGLPLSVQFVGRYFDEATVLRVAAA